MGLIDWNERFNENCMKQMWLQAGFSAISKVSAMISIFSTSKQVFDDRYQLTDF